MQSHQYTPKSFSDFPGFCLAQSGQIWGRFCIHNQTHMHRSLAKFKETGEAKVQTWRTRGNAKSHDYIHAAPQHQPWCWQIHNFPLCCEQDSPSKDGQTDTAKRSMQRKYISNYRGKMMVSIDIQDIHKTSEKKQKGLVRLGLLQTNMFVKICSLTSWCKKDVCEG